MAQLRSSASDNELLNFYLQGDETSLAILIKRHKTKIFTQIMMFVKDQMTAEDLFQDTFIKALETIKAGRYNDEGKFGQWVSRIAYNMCVDHHRRNKRKPGVVSTDDFDIFDVLKNSEKAADENMMSNQSAAQVRKLVDMLPDEQREVIMLRHFADLSFKEISALTNVSINTALGRMRYALINIRKMILEKQLAM